MMWNFSSAGWFWALCMVGGLALLSVGLIVFSRWFSNTVDLDSKVRRHDAALNLAGERFARGEITAEELATIKQGLST
jgi:uncharacterized membrane protein